LAIHTTDFGIVEDIDVVKVDEAKDIYSRHFRNFEDLEEIMMPVATHNEQATEIRYQIVCDVYSGTMPVKKVGQTHIWFTPWDYLIRWWSTEEAMLDMVERPALVHAAVEPMVDAWMVELDQFIELNALSLDCNNTRVGSGGYGYTRSLPGTNFDPGHVKPGNMWGCSNAQTFSHVSPSTLWEYAVQHDLRWLARWGLTYYGCCEPVHTEIKIDILGRIPNLLKISASPWCKVDRLVDKAGSDFVLSRKPNPAVFVTDSLSLERARQDMTGFLERSRGCHVELIMKDNSTVQYDPRRLCEWAEIAMQVEGAAR
jgi:hypothetical protein